MFVNERRSTMTFWNSIAGSRNVLLCNQHSSL